jgi:hypothetical protein
VGPRIFGIIALHAPVVAVIRWGSDRLDARLQVGSRDARLRTRRLAPRHDLPAGCDLSPDGRWFSYFALKASAEWELGPTYIAISRLPWLTALAAWGIGSTWTRGITVRGTHAAICGLHGRRTDVRYELRSHDLTRPLEHVQWAEWDAEGSLLVATDDGRLQIRDGGDGSVRWEGDESAFEPDPRLPPAEASNW